MHEQPEVNKQEVGPLYDTYYTFRKNELVRLNSPFDVQDGDDRLYLLESGSGGGERDRVRIWLNPTDLGTYILVDSRNNVSLKTKEGMLDGTRNPIKLKEVSGLNPQGAVAVAETFLGSMPAEEEAA